MTLRSRIRRTDPAVKRAAAIEIRCLSARSPSDVEIEVSLANDFNVGPVWEYSIGLSQESRGSRRPILKYERVRKDGRTILDRPKDDPADNEDKERMTETHLEHTHTNQRFREIADYFSSILYLHLVPQLLRHPREFSGPGIPGDPFGRNFLERIARVPEKTRQSRLHKIEAALRHAVPQLKELTHLIDKEEGGVPHLEAVCEHWRGHGQNSANASFPTAHCV
jgi:hypothetical protein